MKEKNGYTRNIYHDIKRALLSGFIASAISSAALVLLTVSIGISEFDYLQIQSSTFGLKEILYGWIIYFFIGTFIWGLIYIPLEHQILSKSWLKKGMLYGFVIWTFLMIVVMPIVGAGVFANKYEMSAAFVTLITNVIFGITLACFYNRIRNNRSRGFYWRKKAK